MTTMDHPLPKFTEAKQEALDAFERDYFTKLDAATQGNVSEMARWSGMQRAHIRLYLDRHGIGGRAPVGRPRDAARAALARLAEIISPRDGETLEEAAARLAKGKRRTPRKAVAP